MHPRSQRWQLLDYDPIRMRDRPDVLITKVIRDADGWTDHHLTTIRASQLSDVGINYATVETRWCQLRNVIQSTALEVLGRARSIHQDLFDDNDGDINNLLAEENGLHKAYMDLRHPPSFVIMRVATATVHDLLFADECALNTTTEENLQRSIDLFDTGCANFGLTISTAKKVVSHKLPSGAEYNAHQINVNGAQLKKVKTFGYLRSTLSRNTRIDDEVAQRISKASQAFSWLQASMWNRHGINLNTKLKM
ncbi:unnamed protein product [Schistocephalus solidus]|uniref:Reverse transcriptase domain-containing protein n=1 Tax=Schistocephalus solidus TaxID=70667 RepID=A0A183SXR2_SCHSO|nr:unnamed protein product [Schistocephalus solidus]